MHEVLAEVRDVFKQKRLVREGDVVKKDQVLVDLTHVADVRHNRLPELLRQQADREELADPGHACDVHLHEVHGLGLQQVLEDDAVGHGLASGDTHGRYRSGQLAVSEDVVGVRGFLDPVGIHGGELAADLDRALKLRVALGPDIRIALDANQQWPLPRAIEVCGELAAMDPFWIEEPTHPDDVFAHRELARAIAPIKLAAGEAVPNRVIFKNLLQAEAMYFVQVDATRVGGVSEFITVSLLARKFGLPVVPHVGDMGQIHQHLVLFNRVAMGHEEVFLEYIPHLREHFTEPARVEAGRYRVPTAPGSSSDLR